MADVTVGLFVRLEAADGQAQAVADFLVNARDLVNQEPGTTVWYALRFGPTTFGIFDGFDSEESREAHLNGPVALGLADHADLFATPPSIERVDVLTGK
jgi:quinol monooxygenase YgiN